MSIFFPLYKSTLMNFIIRIYRHTRIDVADFGNYEIHSPSRLSFMSASQMIEY